MCSLLPMNLLPKCVPYSSVMASKFLNSGGSLTSLVRRINYKVPTTDTSTSAQPLPITPPVPMDKAQASHFINSMSIEERTLLLTELRKVATTGCDPNRTPSRRELFQLAYHHSLPFIGFGFLDNFVMILAGEYIDVTLGARLGISTMAAAALGNTISDMMGVGSAWYVETLAVRLGAECPPLAKAQLDMLISRIATNLGRCLGVMLGCLLGMLPLLFINTSDETGGTKQGDTPSAKDKEDIASDLEKEVTASDIENKDK
jgi:hypothetical protein